MILESDPEIYGPLRFLTSKSVFDLQFLDQKGMKKKRRLMFNQGRAGERDISRRRKILWTRKSCCGRRKSGWVEGSAKGQKVPADLKKKICLVKNIFSRFN